MKPKELSANELLRREKISKAVQDRWKDPKVREQLIKKQKQLGFRNYPTT